MIMCGKAYESGTLIEDREKILKHLLDVRDTHLEGNSWEKTIKAQFESAYQITSNNKNNLYDKLSSTEGETYKISI